MGFFEKIFLAWVLIFVVGVLGAVVLIAINLR